MQRGVGSSRFPIQTPRPDLGGYFDRETLPEPRAWGAARSVRWDCGPARGQTEVSVPPLFSAGFSQTASAPPTKRSKPAAGGRGPPERSTPHPFFQGPALVRSGRRPPCGAGTQAAPEKRPSDTRSAPVAYASGSGAASAWRTRGAPARGAPTGGGEVASGVGDRKCVCVCVYVGAGMRS